MNEKAQRNKKTAVLLCACLLAVCLSSCGSLKPVSEEAWNYSRVWPAVDVYPVPQDAVKDAEGNLLYYTMEQNGAWGLMRTDGTVVLPCEATQPVMRCNLGNWHWAPDGTPWERIDALNAQLKETGDGFVCGGHGGGSKQYVWVRGEETNGAQYYEECEGNGTPRPAGQEEYLAQGGWLPVQECTLQPNEMWGGTAPVATGAGYNFINAQGNLLVPDTFFESVGRFGGASLAPVEKDGKWAYVDRTGTYKTEFIYDGAWGTSASYNPATGSMEWTYEVRAYDGYDGFICVVQNGKWGVLDETGREVVPCEYEGAVPSEGGAWIRQQGAWRQYRLQ